MSTRVTQWKLRRLGPRAVDVLERHAQTSTALAAFQGPLVEANQAYTTTFDQLRVLETSRATELAQGKAAVMALYKTMREWVSVVEMSKTIDGFDGGSFGDNLAVMDDIIHDAEAFMEVVQHHAERIESSDALLTAVGQALELARKEWGEAQALRQEHQDLVKQNRENAIRLHDILISFRSTLAHAIGRSAPDFQRLRTTKVDRQSLLEGDDDGSTEDPSSDPVSGEAEDAVDDDMQPALAS